MRYYHSDKGLWPFQAELTARAVTKPVTALCADAGLGKTHMGLALSSVLLEDGLVDHVIIVAEKGKLVDDEWPSDLRKFSTFDWKLYTGPPAQRTKIRDNLPQLLLSSFDIIKRDAAVFPPKRGRASRILPKPGPLLEALEGKRVLVIYDEVSRISNRGSDTYKAHRLMLDTFRENGGRVMAMTATFIERDPVSAFDLGRLLFPEGMCTVDEFERSYVTRFDIFRKPIDFKNLKPEETKAGVVPFTQRLEPIMLRKRKTDADVIDFFPKKREMEPTFVTLGDSHRRFYDMVHQIAQQVPDEWEQKQYVTILRQIAAHPMSLTLSEGRVAKAIVEHVTPAGLEAMGSAKMDRMLEWANEVVRQQGAQAIIFTWFADSVLPLLETALESSGFLVSVNKGGMSQTARSNSQRTFKAGETEIFLSSDAGAKGLNLPEATYLLHYERPPSHTNFLQRSDRVHRIDSLAASVFIYSLVARDTIEEGLLRLSLRRNEYSDKLQGDDEDVEDNFLTAKDRRLLLAAGRKEGKHG